MEERNNKDKKSWFERNAWWIVLGMAIFIVKKCPDLS